MSFSFIKRAIASLCVNGRFLVFLSWLYVPAVQSSTNSLEHLRDLADQYPDKTGVYVLEKGEELLLARAWLTDKAVRMIDIQCFIWSTDNIGTLASEAQLRAAERGVRVRVIVDDLLIDAEHATLLALAAHPNVDIRIYNPKYSVGTSMLQKVGNLFTDFRAVKQRMHDKTAIFDGLVGITGGRNMADEYYDYDYEYNFRDRDVLLVGSAAEKIEESFERFWKSPLAVPVEQQLRDEDLSTTEVVAHHVWLHGYAQDPINYTPRIRTILDSLDASISHLFDNLAWCETRVISDQPGKNDGRLGLKVLASLVVGAILIFWPGVTVKGLLVIFGFWAVLQGANLFLAGRSAEYDDPNRTLLTTTGTVLVVIGLVLIIWPGVGMITISLLVGALAFLIGALLVFLALRLRRVKRRVDNLRKLSR